MNKNKPHVVDVFTTIVKLDSVSGSELQMSNYLKGWLDKTGFIWRSDKLGSIIARPKDKGNPRFLLCAHMDTVEPGKGINPIIRNGFIQSSGQTILGADNKAAISAIICAVESYRKVKNDLPNIELIFSVREETGGGLEFFPFKWVRSKVGLIFDHAKSHGRIVLSSPYIYNFKINFFGTAAHSSRPEDGVNSLEPAIELLKKIKVGRFDEGITTVNVGIVNSGVGINTIPDKTSVQGEIRSLDKNKFNMHIKKLKLLVAKIEEKHDGVKINLKLDGYCGGYQHKKDDPFVMKIISIYRNLGMGVIFDNPTGISDANSLMTAGVKVVNLSDGIENPHTTRERVSIKNLLKLEEIVSKFLFDL